MTRTNYANTLTFLQEQNHPYTNLIHQNFQVKNTENYQTTNAVRKKLLLRVNVREPDKREIMQNN